jgi:hypothetical protein
MNILLFETPRLQGEEITTDSGGLILETIAKALFSAHRE